MKMRKLAVPLLLAAVLAVPSVSAGAPQTGNATAYTYTLAADSSWTRTQDAYLTGEVLFMDSPLNAPEDLYVQDGRLYVADSKNGRVVCRDLETGDISYYGEGILNLPTGVFVNGQGDLYVADMGLNQVLILNESGDVIRTYSRPEDITFGQDAPFKPKKVAADRAGIVTIVSDGSYDGMIQLSADGEFLGYFGYNSVPMTFLDRLQDRFFTEAQKAQLFDKIPLNFGNLALDSMGICYTVTRGVEGNAVKKHNVAGQNILGEAMRDEKDFADIAIGPDGQIFAVTETGLIYEYDNEGNLLLSLGGRAASSERAGLFTLASGITVDHDGTLYILDRERGLVHTMVPTAFASGLHEAIRQYQQGDYAASRAGLTTLLKQTGNIRMVYDYMGKSELQLRDYESAALHFRNAGNQSGYSAAFWEIRNARLNQALPYIGIGLVLLAASVILLGRLRRRRKAAEGPPSAGGFRLRTLDSLIYSVRFLRHPFDSFYEVRVGRKGGVLAASILYALALLAFAFDTLGRGFSFSTRSLDNTSPLYVLMLFLLPVGLFVICSHMVSEIHDGEGRFKTVYIGFAYVLTPFILLLPILTLLTHVLALNESFIVSFFSLFIYAWVAVLLVIAIKEIHQYEFRQVFLNLLLALFLMIVLLFVGSIIGMFWDKVVDIVTSVWKEVQVRVG